MNGTEFTFAIGERVKLRDGIDPVFYEGMSKVGNEGWVTGQRRDRFGLPEIYVRWDPNHWAYNRQRDGWTFQEHFEPVKEQHVSDSRADQAREAALGFANQIAAIFGDGTSPEPGTPEVVPPSVSEEAADYARDVEAAHTVSLGSEAFVTLAITRKPDERAPQGALHLDVVGNSLTPESSALLGAHLSRLGADTHMSSATAHIMRFAAQRSGEGNGGS